ncbi:ultraviolet-B receptor UVR8 [Canna indica]|uniref:Ultraviolet-B receptor UVR8 n=1 Tax=Canna indica TaxID=4628 RepID=A0AAQ3KIX0_9LILI|nr:ultraviolet-B receptor UVR8 [Canna indica]
MARPLWRSALLRAREAKTHPFFGSFRRCASDTPRKFAALWGNGDFGRLGLGRLESQWKPAVCPFFDVDPPVSIACGGAHTLFLSESGRVYASGLNNFGQLGKSSATTYALEPIEVSGLPENIRQISAGYNHSSALTADGELFMWGDNSSGQLGLGKSAKSVVSSPTRVDCLVGINIKMVALGSEHSIAITDVGDALSWGAGGSGRLGHSHTSSIFSFSKNSSEYTPRLIKNLEGIKIKAIAAGMLHSACVDERGSVFIFGETATNKLGFGGKNAQTPTIVQELPISEEVACGGYHTCVVTSWGELYTWGSNENGCLGLGCTNMIRNPEIVKSSVLKSSVSKVACGWKHTAAISGGNIFTWGWGGANGTFFEEGHSSGGQLGHGDDFDSNVPKMVDFGKQVKALHVSCGFNHTGAILEYTGN